MMRFRNSILFIFLFIILLFILWDHLDDRAFGDDLYVVWNSSYRVLKGDWNGEGKYSLRNSDVGHPYLFYAMIALGWRVLGITPLWPHLLTITFACLSLLFTFKLGRRIFDWKVGLLSTLLLFCNPMFISSAAVIHLNIPLQTAYLFCIYYFIKKKKIKFLFGLWGIVLFKAYGIIMAFGLFISVLFFHLILWKSHSIEWKKTLKTLLPFLSAPLVFIIFCILRYFLTGHFISSKAYNVALQIPFPASLGEYFANIKFMAWRRFLKQAEMSFVAIFPVFMFLLSYLFDKSIHKKSGTSHRVYHDNKGDLFLFYLLTYIPVFITLLFFSLRSGGNLCTYMLPFYPLLYISLTGSVWKILKRGKFILYSVVFILCVLGFARWHFTWSFAMERLSITLRKYINNSNPMNLDVTRMPKVLRDAARYIDDNYPGGVINATYPEAMAFEGEWTGYVRKKFDIFFDYDRSFKLSDRNIGEGRTILYLYSGNKRLLDPQIYKERYQAELIRAFGNKGFYYYLELWKFPPDRGGVAREQFNIKIPTSNIK